MVDVTWDQAALAELLNSPEGLVGRFVAELSAAVAAMARSRAPVRRPGSVWAATSDAQPPGWLQASITPDMGYDASGQIYGGVTAAADPAIFLEDPAAQIPRKYPFLSSSLWDVMDAQDL